MKSKRKSAPGRRKAREEVLGGGRILERPDGFYWESKGGETHGPFATLPEAEADMLSDGGEEFEPSETLQEAESELGIAEWIDPDTGGPAEDWIPRLEDH